VVHPQHGAATIEKKVRQSFDGTRRDYYILDIATEQLTVMVPIEKVDELIRPVISKTKSREVLKSLKGEPEEAGSNWSRWYKVLNEKMVSGDIFQVAEVVRDLWHRAATDGLTGLANRAHFHGILGHELAQRRQRTLTVASLSPTMTRTGQWISRSFSGLRTGALPSEAIRPAVCVRTASQPSAVWRRSSCSAK